MDRAEQFTRPVAAKNWIIYVVPFFLFLLLTEPASWYPELAPFLYIAKTAVVGALLYHWRHRYRVDFTTTLGTRGVAEAVSCGLLVLLIWVFSEPYFFQTGQVAGFNPYAHAGSKELAIALIGIRLLGAAVVVPVMEELFWRSFVMRYLIDPDFHSVKIGTFSWFSFLGVAVLFGLEHHRIVAGIIAGLLYGLLLVHQQNLKGAILAHAVTNLGLGIYVVATGSWMFW